MKKISIALLISLTTFLSGCSLIPTTTVTSITTEEEIVEAVEVYTVEDLQNITSADDVELMADLDLTGIEWNPLFSYLEPYTGNFNGNNHTISNMTITDRNSDFNGLFAVVSGNIHDLNILNFSISYTTTFVTYAGGLAGSSSANISNVTTDGTIHIINASSTSYVGLLVGLSEAIITATMAAEDFEANQVVYSSVTGDIYVKSEFFAYVGGLIGKTYNSELQNNQASSTIDVTTEYYRAYVGGLVGHHYGGILIGYEDYVDTTDIFVQNNVSNADISVTSKGTQASVGAFIGYSQYGKIFNNFALASIDASGDSLNIGSFIGEDWYSKIDSSLSVTTFNIVESEGQYLLLSSIIGFKNDNSTVENSYFYVVSNTTYNQELGEAVSLASISTSSFYTDTLLWSSEDFTFDDLINYLPVE